MVFEDLELQHPVVQGPMGGGGSSVELVGSVSDLGGLGGYGAVGMSAADITRLVEDLRSRTERPFAVNLWVSTVDPMPADWQPDLSPYARYFEELGLSVPSSPFDLGPSFEQQVEALLEAAPRVFSFVYGIPPAEVLEACSVRGIKTVGTATTPEEAVTLQQAGVDAVVASGQEAGGHRGSFLRPASQSLFGTMALVPLVVNAVDIPVIAAGGIVDQRGVKAALALGASAVQVGTAFLACEESGAHPVHRAMLLEGKQPTELTAAFSGRLARGFTNRLTQEVKEPLPYPIQRRVVGALRVEALAQGRTDLVGLWAGQGVGLLKHRTVAEVMRSLVG